MTNASRWLLLIPVLIAAAAVPTVLALRDPLHDARNQLAAMTPAQRKEIERNRDAYDRLTPLEQYELRRFNEELAKIKDHDERAELDAVMGRLQAWVATFPDDVRAKYDSGMPSERIAILKSQLQNLEQERSKLVAQVSRADVAAKGAVAGKPQQGRKQLEIQIPLAEQWVRMFGTEDDQRLIRLVKESDRLNPFDKSLALTCLPFRTGGKGKRMPNRRERPDPIPIALLRQFSFVPAFARLPDDPKNGLPDENRAEISKAIAQIYLLKPLEAPMDGPEVYRRLNLDAMFRPGPLTPQPVYLIHQLALLKDYADDKRKAPKQDVARIRILLGKSP